MGFDAPLQSLDLIHEILNVAVGFFWLLGYAALLQKLRQDKSATGLSFQMLLALFVTELNNLIAIVLAHSEFSVELRTWRLLLNCLTCFISLFTYSVVVRKYQSSYEYDRDSFGAHPLNLCCLKRKRVQHSQDLCGLGIRPHWVTLYVYALILGALLQKFRRHALPSWFGFWECCTDALMALALLPQLHMFWINRQRRVSGLLGRFIFCLLLAKGASLIYWYGVHDNGCKRSVCRLSDVLFHGAYIPGRGVHIFTETLNILILLEFAYYYVLSKRRGLRDVTLPV